MGYLEAGIVAAMASFPTDETTKLIGQSPSFVGRYRNLHRAGCGGGRSCRCTFLCRYACVENCTSRVACHRGYCSRSVFFGYAGPLNGILSVISRFL
jgi:hypothetical protein